MINLRTGIRSYIGNLTKVIYQLKHLNLYFFLPKFLKQHQQQKQQFQVHSTSHTAQWFARTMSWPEWVRFPDLVFRANRPTLSINLAVHAWTSCKWFLFRSRSWCPRWLFSAPWCSHLSLDRHPLLSISSQRTRWDTARYACCLFVASSRRPWDWRRPGSACRWLAWSSSWSTPLSRLSCVIEPRGRNDWRLRRRSSLHSCIWPRHHLWLSCVHESALESLHLDSIL